MHFVTHAIDFPVDPEGCADVSHHSDTDRQWQLSKNE